MGMYLPYPTPNIDAYHPNHYAHYTKASYRNGRLWDPTDVGREGSGFEALGTPEDDIDVYKNGS